MNQLFNMMNYGRAGNMAGLIQQFANFKNSFSGDPRQQIQRLLNSGKVTQEQYNQAVQAAKAFQNILNMPK